MYNPSALYDHFLRRLQGSGALVGCYCERWYLFLARIANIWIAHNIRFCALHKGYQYMFSLNFTKYNVSLGRYIVHIRHIIKSTTSRERELAGRRCISSQEEYCIGCISRRILFIEQCSTLHCIALHCIALHCIALHCCTSDKEE